MHTDSIERIEVREVNQTKKIGRETLMLSRVAMILKGLQLCGALTAFLSFFIRFGFQTSITRHF